MNDKYHHCNYCHYYGDCSIDEDNELICKKCVWKDILLDAARKRPPSERPAAGELVLIDFGHGSIGIGLGRFNGEAVGPDNRWTDSDGWGYSDKDVKGWWPIKHLVENK